jgi:hypothetical protein
MNHKHALVVVAAIAALGLASAAQAQPSVMDYRWSLDVGLGWDNSLSGNINSGAIGTLNDQVTVILPNSYEEVYGTGFHLRFGGGYLVDEVTEVRATFIYQSLEADLTPMGDIGVSRLYGQYDPYRTWALDGGLRRYFDVNPAVRAYTEGTIGVGFIKEMDVVLSAPAINLTQRATDFYDATAAVSFGGNVGVLWQASNRVGMFGQFGLRWTSGLSAIDDLGNGLETINDDSSRWTMPIVIGMRARF